MEFIVIYLVGMVATFIMGVLSYRVDVSRQKTGPMWDLAYVARIAEHMADSKRIMKFSPAWPVLAVEAVLGVFKKA